MIDVFRTLIIPATHVELARTIAASFGSGGVGMWTTPVSSNGLDPASHYISSGGLPLEFANLIPLQVWQQDENNQWTLVSSEVGDSFSVYELVTKAGVSCTQSEIDEVYSVADATTQEPFLALDRLGLSIIHSQEV